jgi:hypothetical protein
MRTCYRTILLSWIFLLPGLACAASLEEERGALETGYREKLIALAASCEKRDLPKEAQITHEWRKETPSDQIRLYVPSYPRELVPADPLQDMDAIWQKEFYDLRIEYADALFQLAKKCAAQKQGSFAWQLAHETLRENPEHEVARKLLGYLKFRGIWCTPYVRDQLVAGQVWHAKRGWISKGQAARVEKETDSDLAKQHDIRQVWKVRSEHFNVTTHDTASNGVELSEQLERLHTVWRQLFIGYLASDGELQKWFAGNANRPKSEVHQVHCFRDQDEYNAALIADQPRIGITIGIYLDHRHAAYFFAGHEQTINSVHHEGTHQLFQESRKTMPDIAAKANAWIVEGIAGYMESWQDDGDSVLLGGSDSGRMPAARKRLLEDNFYVPLAELSRLGLPKLKAEANIAMLYSQSSGLATFLMHAEHGKYRDPLVRYLQGIYLGTADETSLEKLSGVSLSDLDSEYRRFCSASK